MWVEVNFLRVTSASSCFVGVSRRDSGFGISVVVFTGMREVGDQYRVIEVFYPLPLLKCLGLDT